VEDGGDAALDGFGQVLEGFEVLVETALFVGHETSVN
jgi:hypothetical protein